MSEAISQKSSDSLVSILDPSRRRDPPDHFECGEFLDKGDSSNVYFFCTVPGDDTRRLTFSCRDRSVGVLRQDERKVTNEGIEESREDVNVDPNFFDFGYTLAGRTGFQVWAGTRIMLETLLFPSPADGSRLKAIQNEMLTSCKKVLELGAGVGVVSLSLAASSSVQVLLTDLPTLVEYSILPNLKRNENVQRRSPDNKDNTKSGADVPPKWLCKASSNQIFEEEEFDGDEKPVYPIGNAGGWASVAAVDWTKPLSDQVSSIANEMDWIIACDCVWLVSMLESLLETVERIFQNNLNARLLLSFQRRDSSDASRFTRIETIVDAVDARGWKSECLAWRYTRVEGDSESKEVVVLEISQ